MTSPVATLRAAKRVPIATADHVAELIAETGQAMHYRQIEEVLRSRGFFTGRGKDAANSLLARYFDDGRLFRPARGTYDLRRGEAPGQARGGVR